MKSLLLLFILLIAAYAQGQSIPGEAFASISTAQGLSNSTVNCMIQDQQGFLWIGTNYGLNRFDGYTFETFFHVPNDKRGILRNSIRSLFEDSRGNIWILFTDGGASVYDPHRRAFTNYLAFTAEHSGTTDYFFKDFVGGTFIVEDLQGDVWIGTMSGICRYEAASGQFRRYLANKPDKSNIITTLCIDDDGTLWAGSQNGLWEYQRQTDNFVRHIYDPIQDNAPNRNAVSSLMPGASGNVWVGTRGRGLLRLYRNKGQIRFDNLHKKYGITGSWDFLAVNSIVPMPDGALTLATGDGLLYLESPKDSSCRFQVWRPDEKPDAGSDRSSISTLFQDSRGNLWFSCQGNSWMIRAGAPEIRPVAIKLAPPISGIKSTVILEDRTGVLWFGTSRSGLYKYDLNRKAFYLRRQLFRDNQEVDIRSVYAISRVSPNRVYIGLANGFAEADLSLKTLVYQGFKPASARHPSAKTVGTIYPASDGQVWLGYYDGQISRFDPASGQFVHYQPATASQHYFGFWSPRNMIEDRQGRIWIAASQGIARYEAAADTFVYFRTDPGNPNALMPGMVWSLYRETEKDNDTLWVGTASGGLYALNTLTGELRQYANNPADPYSLPDNHVKVIARSPTDRDSILWLGTSSGLCKFNTRTHRAYLYQTDNYKAMNSILSIVPDERGNLWLSTMQGLSCFHIATGTFRLYSSLQGLPDVEFNPHSCWKDSTGHICFGSNNGIVYFHPDSIFPNPFAPEVTLTNFRVFNRKVEVGDTLNGQVVLPRDIRFLKRIVLRASNNDFTIEFSGLHFAAPEAIQYAYKLENYDTDWKNTNGANRSATYTNLPPGIYRFVVKAANQDGLWCSQPASIEIQVLPPWWKSLWFRILLVIIFTSMLYIWATLRTKRISLRKQELEHQVAEQTQSLRKANGELELQKSRIEQMAEQIHQADQLKLRFFTNISHEFKTPLTLILGPAESLMNVPEVKSNTLLERKINLILKNGQRLLRLINQLLEIRSMETGQARLRQVRGDINAFVGEIVVLFQDIALQHNLHIAFTDHRQPLEMDFDPDKIEKVMYNLLSNAVKYTPAGGKIKVGLGIDNNRLTIQVEDTGIGIPPEYLPHIFDRFFKAEGPEGQNVQLSAGIGLSITKDIVEMHGGSIEVKSEPGVGTQFRVHLPLSESKTSGTSIEDTAAQLVYTRSMLEGETIAAPQARSPLPEPSTHTDARHTLLLVEDNSELMSFLIEGFSPIFNVIAAPDGMKGREIAFSEIPDLIVSDVMMPGISGIELCRAIKTDDRTSHIPVILLTARASKESQLLGLETGADDYIVKPFSFELLKQKLLNIMASRERMRALLREKIEVRPGELSAASRDQDFIARAIQIAEQNLENEKLGVDFMADALGMGRTNLYKKFRALTDMSINDFIKTIRIRRAAQYLDNTNLTIEEIMYKVGYRDRTHFNQQFAALFGLSPSAFRKREG